MITKENHCQTCGTTLARPLPGFGQVCPSCVVLTAQTPAGASSSRGTTTATWADAFPQLAILQLLQDDAEAPVYLTALLGHDSPRHAVLQIVTGSILRQAAGAPVLQAHCQRLASAEIDGLLPVLDHGDLADAYFLLSEAPESCPTLPQALAGREPEDLGALLHGAELQMNAVIRVAHDEGLSIQFRPHAAFYDEATEQCLLTPDLLPDRLSPAESPLTVPNDLAQGSRLGPFALLTKLGEGAFGEVWKARQAEPVEREVGLKGGDGWREVAFHDSEWKNQTGRVLIYPLGPGGDYPPSPDGGDLMPSNESPIRVVYGRDDLVVTWTEAFQDRSSFRLLRQR